MCHTTHHIYRILLMRDRRTTTVSIGSVPNLSASKAFDELMMLDRHYDRYNLVAVFNLTVSDFCS